MTQAARGALPPITDEMLERACFNNNMPWTFKLMEYARREYVISRISAPRIAKVLGISDATVIKALRIMGVEIRPTGTVPMLSPEKKAEAAELLKQYNQRQVAEMLGASRHAIQSVAAMERQNAQHQVH